MVLFRWRNRWEPHRFGSITTVYWDSQETQSSPTHRKKLQGILLTHDLPFFFPCEMSEWQRCSRLGDLGVYCSRKLLSLRSQKCHFMCFCFSLHKISGVIGKAQCLCKKMVKQWCHRGGYEQSTRCVPFRWANAVTMPLISSSLCLCAELQESSISRLWNNKRIKENTSTKTPL